MSSGSFWKFNLGAEKTPERLLKSAGLSLRPTNQVLLEGSYIALIEDDPSVLSYAHYYRTDVV